MRCGASTAILAAIADGDAESADADGPNRLALEALRAFNADNASAPVQALLHNVSSAKEWQADRLSRLSRHYGWTPARLPGATDHSRRFLSAAGLTNNCTRVSTGDCARLEALFVPARQVRQAGARQHPQVCGRRGQQEVQAGSALREPLCPGAPSRSSDIPAR